MLIEQASKYKAKVRERRRQTRKQAEFRSRSKASKQNQEIIKALYTWRVRVSKENIIPEDVRKKLTEIAKQVTRNPESKTREKKAKRFWDETR